MSWERWSITLALVAVVATLALQGQVSGTEALAFLALLIAPSPLQSSTSAPSADAARRPLPPA